MARKLTCDKNCGESVYVDKSQIGSKTPCKLDKGKKEVKVGNLNLTHE